MGSCANRKTEVIPHHTLQAKDNSLSGQRWRSRAFAVHLGEPGLTARSYLYGINSLGHLTVLQEPSQS